MKQIPLTKGKVVLVADEHFRWLNNWKWQLLGGTDGYAYRYVQVDKKRYTVLMHRMIMGVCGCEGIFVDHINGDGLDNRIGNLRLCSHAQNLANSKKRDGCTSQYKGVSKRKDCNRWVASIKSNGKSIHLGLFEKEIDAAISYNERAKELFGEFARLNKVLTPTHVIFRSKP